MIKHAFNQQTSIFIPFMMAGYPNPKVSLEAMVTLATAGSAIIELGVPFSDPIADGPINQMASHQALACGMNLTKVLGMVGDFRTLGFNTPILLFTYLNPLLAYGYQRFCQDAKALGVDGLLIVDLPPEEGEELLIIAQACGLEIVLLASPTTTSERLLFYATLEPAFIYYISRLGVTGIQTSLSNTLNDGIRKIRQYLPDIKVAVGFGISSTSQVKMMKQLADGVIVGSKLVQTLGEDGLETFSSLARSFVDA
jgi:tryptophan synthase alpha chain